MVMWLKFKMAAWWRFALSQCFFQLCCVTGQTYPISNFDIVRWSFIFRLTCTNLKVWQCNFMEHWNSLTRCPSYSANDGSWTRVTHLLSSDAMNDYRTLRPQDTSAWRHSRTRRHRSQDTLTPKNVVWETSTRVLWSRKSRDTLTQDNSDETQLQRWFVLNFGTNFVRPKCLGAEVSCGRSVRLPNERVSFDHTCVEFYCDRSVLMYMNHCQPVRRKT